MADNIRYVIGENIAKESGTTYIGEIDKIETSDQPPEIKLELLDILVRDYLKRKYHFRKAMEYEEMIEFFMQKNKPNMAAFCHEMIIALYSGDMVNMNNVSVLLEDGKAMIEREESVDRGSASAKKPAVSLLGRLGLARRSKSESASLGNIGKQTKKEIDKYLEEGNKVVDEVRKSSVLDETQKDNSILYELNPALVPNQNTEEPEELRAVRNIDDLDRIKQKIRQRKIIVRKESQGSTPNLVLDKK